MRDYTVENVLKLTANRKPNFDNLLAVLNKKTPARPTLFEFFLNDPLEAKLAQADAGKVLSPPDGDVYYQQKIKAFRNAGYDYVTLDASTFGFKIEEEGRERKASVSANHSSTIVDWDTFNSYEWENPCDYYDGRLERLKKHLPDGMKFIVFGNGGVLENVLRLTGFDNLCYMTIDEPELVQAIADNVGQRLYDYYEQIVDYDCVGAIISNDDWGFNTQTMLSTEDMRKYIIPWHKKIAALAHKAGKPAILHSCGNLEFVYDDIINDIKFDGKHSYEDKIEPVEQAYDKLKGKLAVLGGIDVDFVCRAPIDDVFERSLAMAKKTNCEGFALGTGNSVPYYVPDEKYLAMILAALVE